MEQKKILWLIGVICLCVLCHAQKGLQSGEVSQAATAQSQNASSSSGRNDTDANGNEAHHQMVQQRGDHVMGFSHDKATHHFRLFSNGGAIEVEATNPSDLESRDQIRAHLAHIAYLFAQGDFQSPMLIHDRVPPGVPTLDRLKSSISYKFEETSRGARVRITTGNAEAVKAIHEFLKFQISDHLTGDSTEISKSTHE